jgi:hypothetical protein
MDVDRVLAGERGGVGIGIIDRPADGNGGIVDEDVEPSKVASDALDQLIDFGG